MAGDMNVTVGANMSDFNSGMDAGAVKSKDFAAKVTTSMNQVGLSFEELRAKMLVQKALMETATDPSKIIAYNRAIQDLNAQMKTLASSGMDQASRGATKLSNAINNATDGNAIAAREINNLSRRVLLLASSFAFGAAIQGVELLVSALSDAFTGLTNTGKAQAALDVAMAEAKGSVGGEIVELQSLVSIAKDTSLSYDARTQAINELNKEYPDLHKNITLENVNTAAVTAEINKEIEAIKRRSQAKAIEKLIDEASVELEKAKIGESDKQGFWKTLPAQIEDFGKSLGNTISGVLGAPGLVGGTDNAFHKAFVDPIIEAQTKIDTFSKQLQQLNTDAAKAGTLFQFPKGPKANPFEIDLKALQANWEAAQEYILRKYDANLEDAKKNGVAVNEALFNGVVDENNKEYIGKIAFLEAKLALDKKYNKATLTDFEALKKAEKELTELDTDFTHGANKDIVVQVIPDILPPKASTAEDFAKMLTAKIDPAIKVELSDDTLRKSINLDTLMKQEQGAADLANDVLSPAFDSVFKSIQDGGKDVFKNFLDSLAQAVEQIGFTILKTLALKAIMSAINPLAATTTIPGVAGDFADILGFASGGEIKGPGTKTSDSILARLSVGEYVMKASAVDKIGVPALNMLNQGMKPLDFEAYTGGRFPKFASGGFVSPGVASLTQNSSSGSIGGGQAIELHGNFELRNDKLVLALKRGNAQLNRSA